MCPSHQQHVNQTATVWEVDIDVTKVGFGPLSGSMIQWKKRLSFPYSVLAHVAANLVIAARETLFDNPPKDLGCRMTLFLRCRLVGLKDFVNERHEGPQLGRSGGLGARIRLGFRRLQCLSDLPP